MKCPYPDCQGVNDADDAFCGECGRSLAPADVAAYFSGQKVVPPKPKPNRTPLILGGVAGVVLLLLLGSFGAILAANNKPTPTPTATVAPTDTTVPATATPLPPTDTPAPTDTPVPPTEAA